MTQYNIINEHNKESRWMLNIKTIKSILKWSNDCASLNAGGYREFHALMVLGKNDFPYWLIGVVVDRHEWVFSRWSDSIMMIPVGEWSVRKVSMCIYNFKEIANGLAYCRLDSSHGHRRRVAKWAIDSNRTGNPGPSVIYHNYRIYSNSSRGYY